MNTSLHVSVEPDHLSYRALDLSETGIHLSGTRPLETRSLHAIRIDSLEPVGDRDIIVAGRVAWCRQPDGDEREIEVGIHFVALSPYARRCLRATLDRVGERPRPLPS